MKIHKNFFETVAEANIRLRESMVVYDRQPYLVKAITNHRSDEVFRIYLWPVGVDVADKKLYPSLISNFVPDDTGLGAAIDTWMKANPSSPLIRKRMDSPLFNKFRPFPLGMVNYKGTAYYCQRTPNRRTEQGLVNSMVIKDRVELSNMPGAPSPSGLWLSAEFREMILGNYPTAQECIDGLNNPKIANDAVAFHRDFAFIRGPIDLLFLGYKSAVVGLLPNNDLSTVKLDKKHLHCKEAVEELKLFNTIRH